MNDFIHSGCIIVSGKKILNDINVFNEIDIIIKFFYLIAKIMSK